MSRLRLVVTGKEGQVTRALQALAGGELAVIALGRETFDLAAEGDATDIFAREKPDVIVNAGAYTAVDRAESERELAFAVNGRGAGRVAQAAAALNVPVIQISTDYVFDGSGENFWREDDPTGPIGVYGASKLAGEEAVRKTWDHVILRTSWVYAPWGANFVKTMLRLASARPELRVVADQRGTPTSALDIAGAIVRVARNLVARPEAAELRGTFHLTSQGETTWADFAREIFAQSRARGGPSAAVVSIATSDYPTPARRPANSRLSTEKLATVHGVRLPHWKESLARVMDALADAKATPAA